METKKEKLKGMGPKKKLEYIWMYYKPAIFGVIAVIALIFGIKNYYEQCTISGFMLKLCRYDVCYTSYIYS